MLFIMNLHKFEVFLTHGTEWAVSESTPSLKESTLAHRNERASLRVDSSVWWVDPGRKKSETWKSESRSLSWIHNGWVDPGRKSQKPKILYISLRVDSYYGGVDPGRKYRMLFFVLCKGRVDSRRDQVDSSSRGVDPSIYKVDSKTIDRF